MDGEEDYAYQRFVQEWERADIAIEPRARAAHMMLAEAYLDRLEGIARAAGDRFGRIVRRG